MCFMCDKIEDWGVSGPSAVISTALSNRRVNCCACTGVTSGAGTLVIYGSQEL